MKPATPARSFWPLLFSGVILVNIAAVLLAGEGFTDLPLTRSSLLAAIGRGGMVSIGALILLGGVVLMVFGFRRAMARAEGLWEPPRWLPPGIRGFVRWVYWISVYQWRQIDADTTPVTGERSRQFFDPAILLILVMVAVSLTIQEYVGDRGWFHKWFSFDAEDRYRELRSFAWWSAWRVIGYVIMPVILLAVLPRQRIRDYHVAPVGFLRHMPIYVFLFLWILPAVVFASTTESFRHTYPFYKLANRSSADLAMWEAFYAIQFLSLEFFFRGFMLQGLRARLGSNAIFVMIVPYCMIHYGKPLPETLGAIGAGIILGTLAMRTRSIWGGVVIHVAVALTMDVLALRACPPPGHPCGF